MRKAKQGLDLAARVGAEHQRAGRGRRRVPCARYAASERRLATDLRGAIRHLHGAHEERMGRLKFVGRQNLAHARHHLRRPALNSTERPGRRAGERLDVLERRFEPVETLDWRRDRVAVLHKIVLAERPAVAGELQRPCGIEFRLDGLNQRIHRLRPPGAEPSVALLNLRQQPVQPADVGISRTQVGQPENPSRQRLVLSIRRELVGDRRLR